MLCRDVDEDSDVCQLKVFIARILGFEADIFVEHSVKIIYSNYANPYSINYE